MGTCGNVVSQFRVCSPCHCFGSLSGKGISHVRQQEGFWQVRLRNREYKKGTKFQCVDLTTALWGVRGECHAEARHSNSHLGTVGVVWEGGMPSSTWSLAWKRSQESRPSSPGPGVPAPSYSFCFLGLTHLLTLQHISFVYSSGQLLTVTTFQRLHIGACIIPIPKWTQGKSAT